MSIETNTTVILVNDYLELEEVAGNLQEKLLLYGSNHPDFSCVIEKHIEENKVIVKTLYLREHCN